MTGCGTAHETTLLVMAKAPIAGFAKTRLTPPLTSHEAARVAAAALLDTLDSVLRSEVAHRVVALTGDLDAAECGDEIASVLDRFTVIPQRGADFGIRLANAHADAARLGAPVLQIGMDTPQIGPDVLSRAAAELADGAAALLGPAEDGGWWALGLPAGQPASMLTEVPMSTSRTGELTRMALLHSGLQVATLPLFSDVDSFDDAIRVAAESDGRFATVVHEMGLILR